MDALEPDTAAAAGLCPICGGVGRVLDPIACHELVCIPCRGTGLLDPGPDPIPQALALPSPQETPCPPCSSS